MSNSIATAKCPSALTSGNYGMSQNRYTDESKEYIFVKLTDSAYRAIEEYQFSDNDKRFTNGQGPKIKVNGNSGVIFFPTLEDRKFGFTIDDVEGSLECIQQTAEGLDVLGSIPYRMRIHANDDIYDTTRTKMAIAEETEKSKCIREIKPNQTDIGRKVKKSVPSSAVYQHLGHSGTSNNTNSSSNYLNSLNRNKTISSLNNNSPPATQLSLNSGNERIHNKLGGTSSSSSRSPNPTLLGGSGTVAGSSNSGNNRYGSGSANNIYSQSNVSPSLTSASSLSSTLAGGITNGYASAAQHNSPPESTTSTLPNNCVGGGKQSRLGNNAASGNSSFSRSGGSSFSSNGSKASSGAKGGGASNANSGGGKLPDISRRKIRERLIHLLALRPFKKPELYSRLQNEGLRDRERSLISNILKDIATLSRDNTYNLRRQMWNDVNENWPYYTEQELQQLKRRKPQNLTPPLSSDAGSSTSGQSPTSIHTGSPPPIAGGSGLNGGNGLKRTSLEYDEPFVCTVQPKKQRISHFKKDAIAGANPANSGSTNSSGVGNGSRGVSYGTNNSGGSTNYPMHRSKQTATSSTYSPQGSRNAGHGDDSSGNTDLSYNVLNNMDDFMLNIEQQQGGSYLPHSSNSARKSSSSGNNKAAGSNPKENRHSGNSNSSSNVMNISPKSSNNIGNKNYNVQENEGNSSNLKHTMKRGALAGSPKGSLPYGVNFVPESGSSSRSTGRDSSSTRNGGGNYHRQSPSYMQQQHQKSSVIYSPKMPTAAASGTNEREEHVPTGRGGSTNSSSSNNKSQAPSRLAASATTTGSKQQPRASGVRSPTPQEQEQQRHLQQVSHYQSQQTHSASTHSPVQRHYNPPQHPYQQLEQQQPQLQSTSQLPPTQHSAITDAPNADAAERPTYDFSMYTAIKSIEQRRQYKTEFERDFDEYNKLLERLEDVRRNFHVLAEQLRRVPQGCSDYEHIQQQIVAEYERIENEEELKRDKQRFYYLHAKLAHIKQLVTDYDHTLRSMVAAAAAAAEAAQQHASTTAAMHMTANVTSHLVDGSNNVLAAAAAHNARVSPMVSGSESNHSPPSGYQHQTQYYAQQNEPGLFPQYQQHQQQQDEILHRKKKHTHNNVQQQNQQQQYLSPHNQAHTSPAGGQYSAQQQQVQEQFNGHHHYMPAHADVGDEKIVRRTQEHRNSNNDINSCDSSDSNNEDSNDADLNDNDVDVGSDSSSNDENDDRY
ncbi:RNA polymerase II elongation factor Ell [Anastrepha ludens]|uniref:RNA polymerase II elongation factor Ell n=1 Tax=Anastrepha ludens TaxID=28586 RepID=UPI0023AE9E37|nr:RNA polymerase II elongation factor Ell [Anastrepha ludens]XP_053954749.1 RNA polymerase II elongation factor Ell [Anastrepha ludens]XP_053954750.1 RNA polymerase II elongation factor Ell [Anastrepha ludens]XP_053954751.1 RNA polymerase II elongation factor Ell [Anastrepha ludens]